MSSLSARSILHLSSLSAVRVNATPQDTSCSLHRIDQAASAGKRCRRDLPLGGDIMRLRFLVVIGVALIATVCTGLTASADQTSANQTSANQSWPTRPVRFIVTLGAGSGADIGARL